MITKSLYHSYTFDYSSNEPAKSHYLIPLTNDSVEGSDSLSLGGILSPSKARLIDLDQINIKIKVILKTQG